MAGRVALITGAGRGIGAATARLLAAEGWQLVLVDRCKDDPGVGYPLATKDELDAVAAETGGVALVADVRVQTTMDAAVATAVERFGGLDAAVAVAGVLVGAPSGWETGDEAWHANLSVNLEGVWRLARAAVPVMLARPEPRHGRFVAVSSAAGARGFPSLAAYAAAKHGVIGFVRSLAIELGPFGITANAVCPGSTRGPMLDASAAVYGLADPDELAADHANGRPLEPAEVAAAIAWLCGESSSGLTGAAVAVDGGMTAH